ncbi:MAG TPA: NYN domain-containing protein [Gemmatimonadales bacterium]|nr:NYN domain-containing protein [Gemmatimonadales bacterium]
MPSLPASNAALLIDFDNVTLGVRSDLTKELRHLLDSDIIKGKVSVQRAYADWRRYPQYIVPLSESSIDLIFAPAFGTNKKNATDIRLAIDATELVFTRPEIGTFILLSGDSDFSSLVIKLKEYGKYVIGVGIRESASDILIQNCDEYYSYTELAGLTKETDTPSTQRDPWELVVEAVDKMVANRDVMRADRLKQVMQQLDPNFDEGNAGFNRFSKFVQEAGSRGLIKLEKMENGQFEVTPIKGGGAAADRSKPAREASARGGRNRRGGRGGGDAVRTRAEAAAEAPAAAAPAAPAPPVEAPIAPDAEKERGRRRRRGGRGRGRGGEERGAVESTESAVPTPPTRTPVASPARTELTLAEAFHLLTRALGELPTPVAHELLRGRMAALLGREDALLAEKQFPKLLRQANDAEVAEVRMLDETHFEVSPHKSDLALHRRPTAENGNANGETVPTATVAAPAGRFRSRSGSPKRNGEVPLVGVVKLDDAKGAEKPTASPTVETPATAAPKSAKKRSRKRGGASKKAASSSAKESSATSPTASQTASTKPAVRKVAKKATRKAAAKSTKATGKSTAKKSTAKKATRSRKKTAPTAKSADKG